MDNRGIPIVLPAKRFNTTPKRTQQSLTPKRHEAPSSPFFVPSIKNELSLLEAYDTFSETRFLSRYQPTSDDIQCNVRDLYKSNMFTEIASPKRPKRLRSTNLTIETDIDKDEEEDQSELPYLETSKKSRVVTVSSPIEVRTPLGEEALDTFDDSQSDLLPPPPPQPTESLAIIPTQHNKEAALVEPSQEQILTPETPLKHRQQEQDGCAPSKPLLSDSHIDEMHVNVKVTKENIKKPSPVVESPKIQQAESQLNNEPTPRRLTRRQAKLIEENGGNPDFVVPETPPPKKRVRRTAKAKLSESNEDETAESKSETKTRKQKIQKQIPKETKQNEELSEAVVEKIEQGEAVKEEEEEEKEKQGHVITVEEEHVITVEKEEHAIVAEKTEEEVKEEEMRRAYRKKKSDAEIKTILKDFPQLARYYELIERAGSGTFSRVYKAKDLLVNEYMPLNQRQKLASALGDDADVDYVAIKLIFDISKPVRVAHEIQCLASLRYSPGITPLITAFRHDALTFVVLPYIKFDHFDDFYKAMRANDVRNYISELLIGLKSTHEKGFMHRDVKPGNFLYNVKSKTGYLADFGLARMSSHKSIKHNPNTNAKNSQYTQKEDQFGYYAYDSRSSLQADRSGTKGFRAPEVMLRYRHQTSAIDIWAVGVIIFTILTARYPIFEPEDDADGIMELAHVFGMKKLKEFTEYYGRAIHTNIPTIPEEPINLVSFCRDINKERIDKWDQEEYILAVDLMVQCLQLIHTDRITAADALNHPFFTSEKAH